MQQPLDQAPVIEHVGVHQHHRAAAFQHRAAAVERHGAAFVPVGVGDQPDLLPPAEAIELGLDQRRAVADHQAHRPGPGPEQAVQVPLEQGAATEPKQDLGNIRSVRTQPSAASGGQDQDGRRSPGRVTARHLFMWPFRTN